MTRTNFISAQLALGAALALAAALPARAGVAERSAQPVVRVVRQVGPAVVNISTERAVERRVSPFGAFINDPFFERFYQDFFEVPTRRVRQKLTSLGSGVIIHPKGYVVTNDHVVQRGSTIAVTLQDGRQFPARLVGADAESDLSVLLIEAEGETFPAIKAGRSDEVLLGETVIAIGNPFGFSNSVSTGLVSAVNRGMRLGGREFRDLIQTDAAVNPGNSGGPLLNLDGELIGINTAIFAAEGQSNIGIGFAIPVDRVRRISRDLIEHGEVQGAWLGITLQDLSPDLSSAFGAEAGAVVLAVMEGSPASEAGLRKGDVIVSMAGRPVRGVADYRAILSEFTAGDDVPLVVSRDGATHSAPLAVRARAIPEEVAWENFCRLVGMEVQDAGAGQGVVVTKVLARSRAAGLGLKPGDVIAQLGEKEIRGLPDFQARAARAVKATTIFMVVVRDGFGYRVTLPVNANG